MDVIACVVIGGASTMGGSGSVTGNRTGCAADGDYENGLILHAFPLIGGTSWLA